MCRRILEELQRLDVGYGYTSDGGETFPFRGSGVGLDVSLPVRLFEGDFEIHNWSRFSVDAEGRFLMVLPLPESIPDRLRVVVGWGEQVGLRETRP